MDARDLAAMGVDTAEDVAGVKGVAGVGMAGRGVGVEGPAREDPSSSRVGVEGACVSETVEAPLTFFSFGGFFSFKVGAGPFAGGSSGLIPFNEPVVRRKMVGWCVATSACPLTAFPFPFFDLSKLPLSSARGASTCFLLFGAAGVGVEGPA